MKTSGEILRAKRLKLELSVEGISKKLKIHSKYLNALESGDYKAFDSRVIARGFLVKYADFLKVDTEKVLAYWRRDFAVNTPNNLTLKNTKYRFILTPTLIGVLVIFLILCSLFGFGYYQYNIIKQPPQLTIISPENEFSTNESLVILKGSVSTDAEVLLNDKKLFVNENSEFSENLYLSPGVNKFTLKAVNSLGIEVEKSLTIYNTSNPETQAEVINEGSNSLIIMVTGDKPVFVEVKDDVKNLFTGFLLPDVQKEFKGEKIIFYTDAIENLQLFYNGDEVDKGEQNIGNFNKDFSEEALEIEEQEVEENLDVEEQEEEEE